MTSSQRIRPVLGLTLAAALLALAACGGGDDDSSAAAASSEEPTSQDSAGGTQAEPDLEGIPDVVAEVNGEEVTKDEFVVLYEAQFQQAAMQAQSGGEQPDEDALKAQTADNLVSTTLLTQEAEARGIAVTEQDVDDELAALAKQNQLGSPEELIAALEKQGATEEEARAQLETQIVIEQLVADEAGDIEPSEQDLRKIYEQAKMQQAQAGKQGQAIPPYAKVRPQIVEQAKSDQLAQVTQALVDDLRQDADITVNL
ncbi:SurA N-terminal domain-containing protein [Nocardioides sp.]|uniref:SurA N-terminal domain-containing protein n=1 Tax=Nocardioides sp. TaxID=35761 RepID=UPI00286D7987|nr:SurA N-terminal domain-containing protein [Nocardioides sp.]